MPRTLYGIPVKSRQELANGHAQVFTTVWYVNQKPIPAVDILLKEDSSHAFYWVTVGKAADCYSPMEYERLTFTRLTDARRAWARFVRWAKKGIL